MRIPRLSFFYYLLYLQKSWYKQKFFNLFATCKGKPIEFLLVWQPYFIHHHVLQFQSFLLQIIECHNFYIAEILSLYLHICTFIMSVSFCTHTQTTFYLFIPLMTDGLVESLSRLLWTLCSNNGGVNIFLMQWDSVFTILQTRCTLGFVISNSVHCVFLFLWTNLAFVFDKYLDLSWILLLCVLNYISILHCLSLRDVFVRIDAKS